MRRWGSTRSSSSCHRGAALDIDTDEQYRDALELAGASDVKFEAVGDDLELSFALEGDDEMAAAKRGAKLVEDLIGPPFKMRLKSNTDWMDEE